MENERNLNARKINTPKPKTLYSKLDGTFVDSKPDYFLFKLLDPEVDLGVLV